MNNKILMTGFALLAACAAVAMPTKKELAAAKQLVADITAPELEALKMRKKTAKEVGDFHMEQMKSAATEAERFHLLQGAFKLYARGKDYDAAAEALAAMNREVKNLPPEFVVELVQKEMRRVAGEKAPKVLVIFNAARRLVRFRKELPRLEKAAKAKPKDAAVQAKLGECCAELGKWPEALAAFAKSGKECAKMAKGELDGKIPPQTLADFWWDYGNPDDDDEMSVYRVHAAELYRKALADATFVGLRKSRAEMRVAQAKDHLAPKAETVNVVEEQVAQAPSGCAFKINGNTATMVFPNGVTLEFVKCPAGEYDMLYDYKEFKTMSVRITRPFWFSKAYVSCRQAWAANPNMYKNEKDELLKTRRRYFGGNEAHFIETVNRDFGSLFPKGYVLRLPSSAEYEYAYHANTKDSRDPFFSNVPEKMLSKKTLWEMNGYLWVPKEEIPKDFKYTLANRWGIRDMGMQCALLDKFEPSEIVAVPRPAHNIGMPIVRFKEKPAKKDPFHWSESEKALNVSRWLHINQRQLVDEHGWERYHVVIGPDLVKEWKEKHAEKK